MYEIGTGLVVERERAPSSGETAAPEEKGPRGTGRSLGLTVTSSAERDPHLFI